ncbi:MAG: tetratricopeptide repeat protein [Polyangiaceae bacterium]
MTRSKHLVGKRGSRGARAVAAAVGVVFGALLVMPGLATAQGADAEAPADDAGRFFQAAQRAYDEGRYVDAAHGFEQAFKIKPHPAPLINAGDAWDKAGEYALAARAYQQVLTLKQATEQDRIDATDRLTRISPKLGLIELVGNPGIRARVDDEEFHGGDRIYFFPGEHRVTLVDVDGAKVRVIQLAAGTERSVDLSTLLPKRGTSPKPDETKPGDSVAIDTAPAPAGGIRPITYVAYGVGALGVIGGVVFGLQVNSAESSYNENPNRDDLDRFNSAKLMTNISWGIGLVGVGVGTFFLIQDLKAGSARSGGGDHAARTRRLPVDVTWSEQGALLSASGRW